MGGFVNPWYFIKRTLRRAWKYGMIQRAAVNVMAAGAAVSLVRKAGKRVLRRGSR